jgi:hypothetical protein
VVVGGAQRGAARAPPHLSGVPETIRCAMTDETATTDLDYVRIELHHRERHDLIERLEGAELWC